MILQAYWIALILYGVQSLPTITWVSSFNEVRPVLDAHWKATHELPIALSVKKGDQCTIYVIDLKDDPVETDRQFVHEWLHCIGMNHAQITEIGKHMNLTI